MIEKATFWIKWKMWRCQLVVSCYSLLAYPEAQTQGVIDSLICLKPL